MILLIPLIIIYFAFIAQTTKKTHTKYSHKHFSNYLSNEKGSTIFLYPTDKEEIANIIFTFKSSKASSANGIFLLGFTLCKTEQPLQGMELQEKEAQKD